jgi:hypothetical protein
MAKPKRHQEPDDDLTDLEWDLERKPEKPEKDEDPGDRRETERPAIEEPEPHPKPLKTAEKSKSPASTAKQRPRLLPIMTYAIIFVVVTLATAALLIALT